MKQEWNPGLHCASCWFWKVSILKERRKSSIPLLKESNAFQKGEEQGTRAIFLFLSIHRLRDFKARRTVQGHLPIHVLFSSSTSDPSVHASHCKALRCLDRAADGCWCAPRGHELLIVYSMSRPCKIFVFWKPPLKVAKIKGLGERTSRTMHFQWHILLFQDMVLCNAQDSTVYSFIFSLYP